MDNTNRKIVCFAGRAHNGKTMLSEYLVNKYGFERFSVAGALKRICCKLLGFSSIEEMNKAKTVERNYVLKDSDINFLSEESGIPHTFIKEKLNKIDNTFTSVRHALQYIGTDIFRNYDSDWHVKQLEKDILKTKTENITIDDIRFENEYNLMNRLGATLIFIVRPVIDNVSHHKSDEELSWKMFGNVIINNTTPDNAILQLEAILNSDRNKIFEETLNTYAELDLNEKFVITRDLFNILIVKDHICINKFNINDNALIIEDLKKYLKK